MKLLTASILTLALSGCWGGGGGGSGDSYSDQAFGAPACDNPDCYGEPVDVSNEPFDVVITDPVVDDGDYDDGAGGEEVVDIKGTATISWIAPTHNEPVGDQPATLLTNLDGFKIYYGIFPDEYTMPVINITNIGLSSYLIEDLDGGDWFFVMTAYNTHGMESKYSSEVHKEIK